MDTDETAISELTADPDVRQRLALTLTPEDVSPRLGEVLVLQLASAPHPDVDQEMSPLHVGIELDRIFAAGHVFTDLLATYGDAVGLIPCEAADRTAAMYTNADGPITDPKTALTVYSTMSHAGPSLQTAISRAMRTGEVPTERTDGTHPAPGAITVSGAIDGDMRDHDQLDITPQLATALDVVVDADITNTLWLNGASTDQLDPIEPALASAYLDYARQLTTTFSAEAREHLDTYYKSLEITTSVGSDGTLSPTRAAATDTVERLAIASARLELSDTVTPDHVETAVQLYSGTLAYRSVTINAVEYWRACAENPVEAFGSTTAMYNHIIDDVFDRHAEPVSLTAIHAVAAEYDVSADTITEFVESHGADGIHETVPDDGDDSEGPYFCRI